MNVIIFLNVILFHLFFSCIKFLLELYLRLRTNDTFIPGQDRPCRMVLFFHSVLQPDIKYDSDPAASHNTENEQVMVMSAMYVTQKGNL